MNLFGIVTCVAEFVGGGIYPWARVDAIRLFTNLDGFGFVTVAAEILFVVASTYYLINLIMVFRQEGCSEFCQNTWNIVDLFTVVLSFLAIALYIVKYV